MKNWKTWFMRNVKNVINHTENFRNYVQIWKSSTILNASFPVSNDIVFWSRTIIRFSEKKSKVEIWKKSRCSNILKLNTCIRRKNEMLNRLAIWKRAECFAPHSCPTLGQDASGLFRLILKAINTCRILYSNNYFGSRR